MHQNFFSSTTPRRIPGLWLALVSGFSLPLAAGEPGKMTREIWLENYDSSSLDAFKASARYFGPASSVTTFSGSTAPQNISDQFVSRSRAILTAPVSGSYTFWISSDDGSELSLSPTASKFGRVQIAGFSGWVPPGEWEWYATQRSAPVELVAGQKYFIESLHIDAVAGDHMELAWQLPGGTRASIPASALESFTVDPNDVDNDELPDSWELKNHFSVAPNSSSITGQLANADPDGDGYSNIEEAQFDTDPQISSGLPGSLLLETWQYLPLDTIEDFIYNPAYFRTPSRSEFIFSAETPADREDYFGARMRGAVIAPISGNYTFHIAADDKAVLCLSSDASQFNKVKIATVPSATAVREWSKFPSQTSAVIPLIAGVRYYIEAIQTETVAAEHLSLGWKLPGASAITLIPNSALESNAYEPADPDGDGMPSAWEIANGLNPALNDGAADPDGDLIANVLEFSKDTDPQQKNAFVGGLLYEKWLNIPGRFVKDFTHSAKFLHAPDQRGLVFSAKTQNQEEDHFGTRVRGYLIAPPSSTVGTAYTFQVHGDDQTELWLSTDELPWNRVLLARPEAGAEHMDGGSSHSQYSKAVTLTDGKRYFFEILHKENSGTDFCVVNWKTANNPFTMVPSAVLSSFIPLATDADDDYLPDAWEVANGLSAADNGSVLATNGQRGDLDGDGLTNEVERTAGTRADLADTDGDGVTDRDEIQVTGTSALSADSAPFEKIITVPGAAYRNAAAVSPVISEPNGWTQENGKARQDCVRGWLEYAVTLPTAGVYQLGLDFTPMGDAGASPDYEIVFSADGKTIQRETVNVRSGSSGQAKLLMPWLGAGAHTIRVFVDNAYHFRRITVDQLQVLAARGADLNKNGTPDWVDLRLAKLNGFNPPTSSLTSPVCLEGKARWSEMATLNSAPLMPAPDDGWYANLPLHPTQLTAVSAALENGGLTLNRQIQWQALNVFTTQRLTIRKGDSLKITAFRSRLATADEKFSIVTGMPAAPEKVTAARADSPARNKISRNEKRRNRTQTIRNRRVETRAQPAPVGSRGMVYQPADQPVIRTFDTAGTYTIQILHRQGKRVTPLTLTVEVIAAPVAESPVAVVSYFRSWEIASLPRNVVHQLDSRIELQSSNVARSGDDEDEQGQVQTHVFRLNTLEDRLSVFRLGDANGPILGSLPFYAMRERSGAETVVLYQGDLGNDSYAYDMPVIVDGLRPGITLEYQIFLGGITFDDGSITKYISGGSGVDPAGNGLLKFYKAGQSGATCHTVRVLQNGRSIGYYF